MLFLCKFQAFLADLFILVSFVALIFHLRDPRLLMDLLHLELFLVLDGALLTVLYSFLQFSLVNIKLFATSDCQIRSSFTDDLSAYFSKALH